MNETALHIANLISSYYKCDYQMYINGETNIEDNPYKVELLLKLKEIQCRKPNDKFNIKYMERYGIFYHF